MFAAVTDEGAVLSARCNVHAPISSQTEQVSGVVFQNLDSCVDSANSWLISSSWELALTP